MSRSGIDRESEAVKFSDRLAIDTDAPIRLHRDRQVARILPDIAQQDGGAPIDETLRQRGVERIGQLFLQRAGALRHFDRMGQPVWAMRDIGPGARGGDSARQRVDIALHRIEPGQILGEPVARNVAHAFGQKLPDAADGAAMMVRAQLLEVGQAAGTPQPFDLPLALDPLDHERIVGHAAQHGEVHGFGRGAQFGALRLLLQIGQKMLQPVGIRRAVAPEKLFDRREAMCFDRFDLFGREGGVAILAAQTAERAVLVMTARAPGDLRHFADGQAAAATAIIFAQGGEGDMGDVQVQPHADRIGRDQIVDFPI